LLSRRVFNTVSFRLAALCAFQFAVILIALMAFNYISTRQTLEEQLRSRVHDDLLDVMREIEGGGPDSVVAEINDRVSEPFFDDIYFFASDATGTKVAGNVDNIPRKEGWQVLRVDTIDTAAPGAKDTVWGEGKLLSDGTFAFVAKSAQPLYATEHSLIISYVGSALFAGILALFVGVIISRGFINRIDAINNASRTIISGDLDQRIPINGSSDEIDRLSANLNHLFDSNQALIDSNRQVTVNIAHDLRTPLTRLRNKLESASKQPKLGKAHVAKLKSAIEESDQLLATFSALLRIAQIDAGTRKRKFVRINLSTLGQQVFDIYQPVADDAGRKLKSEISPGVYCMGDKELLMQMCVNLVENAIRHTPKGTAISLRVSRPSRLEIADRGPGIPEDQREKVLERFFRLESSRNTPGSGLGLSMSSSIANLHEAALKLSDNNPGLQVSVDFPPSAAS